MHTSFTLKNCTAHVLSFVVFVLFSIAVFSTPALAQTAKYTPLVNVPGLNTSGATNLPDYINKVYILLISIGALFGVVKIAIAGVKYSMSDVVTDKSSARKDIYGVLMGLAILLLPYIVLYTINPELTKLNVLQNATKVNITQSSRETPAGGLTSGGQVPGFQSNTVVSGTPGATDAGTTRTSCVTNPARCVSDCEANGGRVFRPSAGQGTGLVYCDYLIDP